MKRETRTDWDRLNAMRDEEIDTSDSPELGVDFFKEAVAWPAQKRQVTLRLDPEILEYFKSQGRGYQTAINNVLRRYIETHKHS
jgi:uncharacterized protein (DUF4415 family)